MSYWSHNPELYTEIIFKEMVRRGLASEEDFENADEIVNTFLLKKDSWKLAVDAESSYFAGLMDGRG